LYDWDQYANASSWLREEGSKPNRRIALLGYSNGGSCTTWITNDGFFIDLVIALDPTIWLSMYPLENNVKTAICVHDTNWLNPVGHAYLTKGKLWDDKNQTLTTINTNDWHLSVDTDPKIQAVCYKAIALLMK
jgi:dienelactone hydrolase